MNFLLKKHGLIWLISVIFLLAVFLRSYHLELKMRFIWDEGRDMIAIHNMIVNRKLTLFGPYNEIDRKKDFFGFFIII